MSRFFVGLGLALSVFVSTTQAQFIGPLRPEERRVDRESLARIQEWTRVLIHELDNLTDDIRDEIQDFRTRAPLQRLTEQTLAATTFFETALRRSGRPLALLAQRYHTVDDQLEDLFRETGRLPAQMRLIHRTIRDIRLADNRLHYLLASIHSSGKILQHGVARHAHSLHHSGEQFYAYVKAVLPNTALGRQMRDCAKHFVTDTQRFSQQAERGGTLTSLRREYQPVDRTWKELAVACNKLPTRYSGRLMSYAKRIDEAHGEVGRMLQLPGDRQYLDIPSSQPLTKALEQLQGRWQLTFTEENGKLKSAKRNSYILAFIGNRWSEHGKPNPQSGIIRLDPRAKPAVMHYIIEGAGRRNSVVSVIYFVEGNTFKYCYSPRGLPRGFNTRPGDQTSCAIWRRLP